MKTTGINEEKNKKIDKEEINNIKIGSNNYEIIRNIDSCFNIDEINNLYTDYFEQYDYILGDYSYDKLRLKGFCDANNKIFNSINDIKTVDTYIKEYCSYKAKYFLLKKI